MGRTHKIKCWPEPFQALADGTKTFEFRRDDRGYMVGDRLDIGLWDPSRSLSPGHGSWIAERGECVREHRDAWRLKFDVTYVLHGGRFGVPEGHVVMSIVREGAS